MSVVVEIKRTSALTGSVFYARPSSVLQRRGPDSWKGRLTARIGDGEKIVIVA